MKHWHETKQKQCVALLLLVGWKQPDAILLARKMGQAEGFEASHQTWQRAKGLLEQGRVTVE